MNHLTKESFEKARERTRGWVQKLYPEALFSDNWIDWLNSGKSVEELDKEITRIYIEEISKRNKSAINKI